MNVPVGITDVVTVQGLATFGASLLLAGILYGVLKEILRDRNSRR